jgi:hypothetical protein
MNNAPLLANVLFALAALAPLSFVAGGLAWALLRRMAAHPRRGERMAGHAAAFAPGTPANATASHP